MLRSCTFHQHRTVTYQATNTYTSQSFSSRAGGKEKTEEKDNENNGTWKDTKEREQSFASSAVVFVEKGA